MSLNVLSMMTSVERSFPFLPFLAGGRGDRSVSLSEHYILILTFQKDIQAYSTTLTRLRLVLGTRFGLGGAPESMSRGKGQARGECLSRSRHRQDTIRRFVTSFQLKIPALLMPGCVRLHAVVSPSTGPGGGRFLAIAVIRLGSIARTGGDCVRQRP